MTFLPLARADLADLARPLVVAGVLRPGDLAAVEVVADRFGEARPQVLLALALAVRAPRVGHAGVDLHRVREQVEAELALVHRGEALPDRAQAWPQDPAAWLAEVRTSALVAGLEPGNARLPAEPRPFVLQELHGGGALLLTRRLFREQAQVAAAVGELLASAPSFVPTPAAVDAAVARLFPGADDEGAATLRRAATGRLTVVTGGPGTGKTYSVGRLLATLLATVPGGLDSLRVALAAPTGKAAVRMTEGLAEALEDMDVEPDVRAALGALPASTLHRLVGVRPDGSSRHGPGRPLPADVVVVDEASMIDLAGMGRLLRALAPGARLVLLGDPDQLASVEAGTVLADLTAPGALPESARVAFTRSRRFASAPTVAQVAAAIQARDVARAVALMVGRERVVEPEPDPLPDRVRHVAVGGEGPLSRAHLDDLARPYLDGEGYAGVLCAHLASRAPWTPEVRAALLEALESYRVLAAHRRGPRGVAGLQEALAARLRRQVALVAGGARVRHGAHWLGEVLLVTRNAYDVDLRNGDVGLVLPTGRGPLAAYFPSSAGPRELALTRLPPHAGGLAMTVHKSQGSQFRRVALVLPGRPSPLLTRELVYTAVTRARARVDWYGAEPVLAKALARPIQRASGLADLLVGAG